MEIFLLRLHQQQVLHQCHAAIVASHQMQSSLGERDQENFWVGVQDFLNATANISKSCWGQGGRLTEEREPLRVSLGIADNSPLANTDLRNHLEHYDERLDRWYASSSNKIYVDFVIGPLELSVSGVDQRDIFRHFDPETGHVIFWGEHYPISELTIAVQQLLPVARQESAKPHWEE